MDARVMLCLWSLYHGGQIIGALIFNQTSTWLLLPSQSSLSRDVCNAVLRLGMLGESY